MVVKKILLYFACLTLIGSVFGARYISTVVLAQSVDQQRLEELSQQISQYEQELQRLKSQADTLSNQIAQYDAQIKLTTLKISQVEEKISLLGGRINQLEGSLQSLSQAFVSRVVYSYKMTRLHEPFLMIITSPDLSTAFSSYQYLQRIGESDRQLLVRLQNAQVTYEEEKKTQEELQQELQVQKNALGAQKVAKATLLEQTKNNEKKYQELLASARAEFEAIQAIVAGKGTETEVGHVNEGDKIATIIQGPSCNSSGTHLHFTISQDGNTQNPFGYLNASISVENCSGSSCGSSDGDSFNPSGSWNWPISSPIKFFQGYGSTWAIKNTYIGRVYSFHNGIDVNSLAGSDVKAVKAGILYQGSYSGTNGCRLRYVRVHHDEGGLDSFYLHINY
jgi:peptidoglycan hydrolase CwlO-like protein